MKKCITVFFILLSLAITILGAVVVINNPYSGDDYFIKTATMDDRIYCLTNKGLFFEYNLNKEKFILIEKNVEDFYAYDTNRFWLLKEDGTMEDSIYDNKYILSNAECVGPFYYQTKNNESFRYDAYNETWDKINEEYRLIFSNQISAIILDNNNVLRIFYYDTQENIIVAENVIDFCYCSGDETYYYPDLIYITEKGCFNAVRIKDMSAKDFAYLNYSIPDKVVNICSVFNGRFVVKTIAGKYFWGNINKNFEPINIPIELTFVSLFDDSCSLISRDNSRMIYYCENIAIGDYKKIEFPKSFF